MKVLGYSDRISVAPGETIRFHISCEGPKTFRADIVRVICGDENPAGPGYKEELVPSVANRRYPGRKQDTLAGS
jgi:N,N-dimethylformamidase